MRDSHLPQMLFAALGLFILGGCHWDFHAATLLSSQNGDTLSGFEFKYEFSEKSPDGTRYLTYFSGGGTMTLLDVDTHQSVRELEMYYECEGPCLHLAWSPDSQRLAAMLVEGLYIWNAHTGERIKYIAPYPFGGSLTFSPDSKLLATTVGGAVIVWDVPQPRQTILPEVGFA